MSLKIVQAGDPVLRQQARPLSVQEILGQETQRLIAEMRDAMHAAPGVGLAAPQIGHALQLAVIEDREDYHKDVAPALLAERERWPVPFHVIINPKITELEGARPAFHEGCLSLPGYFAIVTRARAVRVECLDENGQSKVIDAVGWHARILQHEIDHLRGALYIDRMNSRTFTNMDNFNRLWKGRPISDVLAALGT